MAPMTENQTQFFLGSLSKALGWPTVTSVMFRRGFVTFWATVLQAHQLRNLMGHSRYSNLASTTYQSDFQAIDLANARDGSAATPTAQASTWRATASAAGTSKSAMAAKKNLVLQDSRIHRNTEHSPRGITTWRHHKRVDLPPIVDE
ncbi:unnamed protein product [Tilletia controversa]|nr:hypothetical protein CF328_g4716 [Tilletia controversa]CAD6931991.1 unnamed protein product [Tilletia controversa]